MHVEVRAYEPDRDKDAVLRIYREVGWCSKPEHAEAYAGLVGDGRTLVANLAGTAECMVTTDLGAIRHGTEDLPFAAVTSVITSRIARKRRLAGQLTARILADEALAGRLIGMLGIFEQGYYNQLGFGNGSYEHCCTFDPSTLDVSVKPRVPIRLDLSDSERMHANRLRRLRRHGACNIFNPHLTRADMCWGENGFGLGYVDDSDNLTHHLWCSAEDTEHGPYTVFWMAYESKDQFLELLALLRSFEDQIRSIRMQEPPGLQFQDLLRKPFRSRQITRRSTHENRMTATAYWQLRILDLPGTLAMTSLDAPSVRFNLTLSDPIEAYLDGSSPWRGVAGKYIVEAGPTSHATLGHEPSLPTLTASVNAFSRMWLGVRPASILSWTDELSGPAELLARLDKAFCLPSPSPDWEF